VFSNKIPRGKMQEPGPPGWGSLKNRDNKICSISTVGLRTEKGCAGDARQKLKSTDPTSRQRGHPTSTNPKRSKNKQGENGKN
jgi:hypothetical protein